MKKIFAIFALFLVAFSFIPPQTVKAENIAAPLADPTVYWECSYVENGECPPNTGPGTTITGSTTVGFATFKGVAATTLNANEALNGTIYGYVVWNATGAFNYLELRTVSSNPTITNTTGVVYCEGYCSGSYSFQMGMGSDTTSKSFQIQALSYNYISNIMDINFTVYLSYNVPIELSTCNEAFIDSEVIGNELPIYPYVETPLGEEGLPPDYMKIHTNNNLPSPPMRFFHLTFDGTWDDNEGNDARQDFEYSFDGVTWIDAAFDGISYTGNDDGIVCIDSSGIIFQSDEEWFYIRVNDAAGDFADNLPDQEPYPTYTLALAEQIAALTCADKFTYDEQDDWLGLGFIYGNAAGSTSPNLTFTVGAWYVLETTGDPSWKDETNTERFDIRANNIDLYGRMAPGGSEEMSTWRFTDCWEYADETETHKRYFFQAPAETIFLWVNDDDRDDGNSGMIGYNIYQVATYVYWPSACERQFKVQSEMFTVTIPASGPNGMRLPPVYSDSDALPTDFQIDKYYMLETSGGPWTGRDLAEASASYKLDIKPNDEGADFELLDTWADAECIVQYDRLGHIRAFFLEPTGTAVAYDARYFMRVDDGGNRESYIDNRGSMDVTAYEASKQYIAPPTPELTEDACNGLYLTTDQVTDFAIYPTRQAGVLVPSLVDGNYYSIDVTGYWSENGGAGADYFIPEVSSDNGVTWDSVMASTDVLCRELRGENAMRIYVQAQPGLVFKLRADDIDGTWGNNVDTSYEGTVNNAVLLNDPHGTCGRNYQLKLVSSTTPGDVYIPGNSEEGRRLALVPGQVYALRISNGWFLDSEIDETRYYDAKLSLDDGANFYAFNDTNMPGYQCYTKSGLYETIYFTAGEQYSWVRVKDRNDDFSDNTNGLYYELYAAAAGTDIIIDDLIGYVPTTTYASCYTNPVRPQWNEPDVTYEQVTGWEDFGAWAQAIVDYTFQFWYNALRFVTDTMNYWTASIQNFFLICPEHTAALQAIMDDMRTNYEPFAILARYQELQNTVSAQVDSYEWTMDSTPGIPFAEGGGFDDDGFTFLPDIADTPFGGAPIQFNQIQGGGTGDCDAHLVLKWGVDNPLTLGFCTVMRGLKLTGANILINVAIIVAAIFLLIKYFQKKWIEVVLYMGIQRGAGGG